MSDGQAATKSRDDVPVVRRSSRQQTLKSKANPRSRSPIFFSRRQDSVSPSSGESTPRWSSASRPTTPLPGSGTGLAEARAELKAAREETREAAFNQFLKDRIARPEVFEAVLDPEAGVTSENSCREDPLNLSAQELRASAGKNAAAIIQMASKSSNLKGTYMKQLKAAATELQSIVEALASRTETEEVRRLRADNARLRSEVKNLKAELIAHRREFAEMKTIMAAATKSPSRDAPAPTLSASILDELKASIVSSVGVMLDARFAGIEERLLPEKVHRPPLSANKRRLGTTPRAPDTSAPTVGGKKTSEAASNNPPEAVAGTSGASQTASSWATVAGKKANKASHPEASAATPPAPPKASPVTVTKQQTKPSLVSPKNAAVIITLAPDAVKKGVTYAEVLEQAEREVDLKELGIEGGMKIRRTVTGARLLEMPKLPLEQSREKADLLAGRLRTALGGVAEVTCPTKTVSLRVSGLDDSATPEKVAMAVVRASGCLLSSVKVGAIQSGPRGVGSTTVHCPVDAAKKVIDAGRLLVGWSSVAVQALEQRPLRCYRCLGMGHTSALCPAKEDRSKLCYRCGVEGHLAAGCNGTVRCAVCADAGIPSDHIMGGKSCRPTPARSGTDPQTQANGRHSPAREDADMTS